MDGGAGASDGTTPVGASEADWTTDRLGSVARQSPLLETRPSLAAIKNTVSPKPQMVFAGIGLVSGTQVSAGLPVDVLGLVLGAETVRRAVEAERLLILVADTHALCQGAPPDQVQARASHYASALRRIAARCNLASMEVMLASELHADPAYGRVLENVEANAPVDTDRYVTREVADIAYLRQACDGLVKVGWALKPSRQGADRDERMFDARFLEWVRRDAWFVYTKAGRVFDDERHKAPPYVERDRDRRICLDPGEDADAKMTANRARVSDSTWRGVCNHLKAITRAYSHLVRPLVGPLSSRVQTLIDEIVDNRRQSRDD